MADFLPNLLYSYLIQAQVSSSSSILSSHLEAHHHPIRNKFMAPLDFANYPKPEEGPDTGYVQRVDHNPVLRGIPLMLGGELYVCMRFSEVTSD